MDDAQKYLNRIAEKDEFNFLRQEDGSLIVSGWISFKPLLYLALSLTEDEDLPIVELGCGHGSTPYLSKYADEKNKKLVSIDTNEEWTEKFKPLEGKNHSIFSLKDKNLPILEDEGYINSTLSDGISVLLVDNEPGERRHQDILSLYKECSIIVIHDSEHPGSSDYKYEKIWPLFKYRINLYELPTLVFPEGATYPETKISGASIVSNKYDLRRFKELKLDDYSLTTGGWTTINHNLERARRGYKTDIERTIGSDWGGV